VHSYACCKALASQQASFAGATAAQLIAMNNNALSLFTNYNLWPPRSCSHVNTDTVTLTAQVTKFVARKKAVPK